MYSVYAIKSLERNYIYVGLTSDLEKRVKQHNSGRSKTTKSYRPFRLIYTEYYSNRVEARKREKYFKSGIGKEFLKGICKKSPDGEIGIRARFRS